MRNLKRVLCLSLAVVMLLGMMVVGTSASSFTDDSGIVNTEAVNTMNSLNIINGLPDGSFNPTGIVTRAEMAKMICVALNGGRDPQLGTNSASYTDTNGTWAAGYIEYCTNLGIVSGNGDGTFAPTRTVTGTEAAKMLLVALGYDAAAEGFTGATWAIGVNVRANQKDLYENLATLNPSAGLSRDNAAQMVYNAINATKVEYDYKLTTVGGVLTTVAVVKDVTVAPLTIMADKFKLVTEYGYMTAITYSSTSGKYTYTFAAGASFGGPAITTSGVTGTFSSTANYSDLFGMKVKVLSKTVSGTTTVYGMYAEDSTVLVSGITGKLPTIAAADTSFKYASVSYKIDSATINVYDYNTATTAALNAYETATTSPYAFKLIDNDDDGKADCAVASPFTVAKVSFVSSTAVTINNVSYKFADCDIYAGIAKNDYAVVTAAVNAATGKVTITEATTVSGTADALESATKLQVGGVWYNDAATKTGDTYALGSSFDLVVVNGYVYSATKVSSAATATNVCLVTAKDDVALSAFDATASIQLIFADGTKKICNVAKVGGVAVTIAAGANPVGAAGTLYTYTINTDGNYELKAIVAADYDSTDLATGAIAISEGKTATGYRFAADAVIFYYTGSAYKATTGAVVNTWADVTSAAGTADNYYADATSGFNYVKLAYMAFAAAPSVDGDLSYGWVTATPSLVKDGDNYRVKMTIWNGTEAATYLAKSVYAVNGGAVIESVTSATTLVNVAASHAAKAYLVSYKDLGSGTISDVVRVGAANAVTGYAGGDEVQFQGTVATAASKLLTIETDSVILYVDTANNAGVTGGSISVATKSIVPSYSINNCYVVANASKEILVLLVDTTNDIDANLSTLGTFGASGTVTAFASPSITITANTAAATVATDLLAAFPSAAAAILNDTNADGNSDSAETVTVVAQDGTFFIYTIA